MDSGGPSKKQKTSGGSLDLISMLPDVLLVLIISYLPFKDVMKTSTLSKRWRYLYCQVSNISFKESEIVNYSIDDNEYDQRSKRTNYVRYIIDWISRYSGGVIESFELCLSNWFGFEEEIMVLIEFAASREVKNLVLDFSNPRWFKGDHAAREELRMIHLPECVYNLTSLVNLKLFACRFDPSKFAKPGSVKSLYFGWLRLTKITSLLSKTPLLEILHIKLCWKVGLDSLTGYNNRLTQLVFKNCQFSVENSKLDLPMIQVFKYSGLFHPFEFKNVNKTLKEVKLDYDEETEYDEDAVTQLHRLLHGLSSAKKVNVCQFVLELLREREELGLGKPKMQTQRLILKTDLDPFESEGISFILQSCPYLETLSFQIRLVTTTPEYVMGQEIDLSHMFWSIQESHICLKKTLKHVEIRDFMGGLYELQWLKCLIRYGLVLERLDLYWESGMTENQRSWAYSVGETVRKFMPGSERLLIAIHYG